MEDHKKLTKLVASTIRRYVVVIDQIEDKKIDKAAKDIVRQLSMHGLGCPKCGSNDESNMGTKNGKHWCGNCGNEW